MNKGESKNKGNHLLRFPKTGTFKHVKGKLEQRMKDERRTNKTEMILLLLDKALEDEF